VDPEVALGHAGVRPVDRGPHVDEVDQLDERVLRLLDVGRVLGVDVVDAFLLQGEGDRVPVRVVDADLAVERRIPQHRPGVGGAPDLVVADVVASVRDPGGVHGVGDRVPPALVVERVLERLPDVGLEVRDIAVVQRLQVLAVD
jgi:hypothetical protein